MYMAQGIGNHWKRTIGLYVGLALLLWHPLGFTGAASRAESRGGTSRTRSRQAPSRQATRPPKPDAPDIDPEKERRRQQAVLSQTLRIDGVQQGESVQLTAVNLTAYHVTFTVTLHTRNLKTSHQADTTHSLAPHASKVLATLERLHAYRPWRYRYHIDFMPGKLDAEHERSAVYTLPYEEGTHHRVVQGYGGRVSHRGDERYAVDFAMHRGTRVTAARAGIVAGTRSDSRSSGSTEAFIDVANYVLIQHADGTIAEYAHLKYEGVLVNLGDRVEQGQLIGYSGDTGYSKGPHLHFAVRRVTSAQDSVTLPVRFLTEAGVVHHLRPQTRYRAVMPGNPD
jgi:murein DD-endopeptidase MepM/ murein hydrolase activator NlpD